MLVREESALKNGELAVIGGTGAAAAGRLTRREAVKRLLAGAGAGAAWPLVTASHPVFGHLASEEILAEAEKLGAQDWKPLMLSAQQNESFTALAERIVPGSTKAQVNRFVDLLLSVEKAERQKEFLGAVAAFDTESRKRVGKGFAALGASEQDLLLAEASSNSGKETSAPSDKQEKRPNVSDHFENLKGWVSGAYYSSEIGMRELGWTEDYVFASFPGCSHPEGHH
jgi:Gluconate 2-dehydrogenase subunit 3